MRTLIPVVLVHRSSVPVLEGVAPAACSMPSRWNIEATSTSSIKHAHGVHVSMDAKQASPGTASGDGRTDTSSLCSPLSPIL